jgi:Ala-tRNA(Pro) deacylase
MPAAKLREFLDSHGVRYSALTHSLAYTAQEIAAAAHVRGREMAKTVIIRIDGRLAMAVLPSSQKVDLASLKQATGADAVELATEQEFRSAFPECELGAMPPFGNLYGMDVYLDQRLSHDEVIAFNAGSHTELVKLLFRDFESLVRPKIVQLSLSN